METKTISAVFQGENDSLGYKTGKRYTLTVRQKLTNKFIVINEEKDNRCDYESIISFLNNWTDIQVK